MYILIQSIQITYVMAAHVLPEIIKIREMLLVIPVHNSSDDTFMVDRIGTGIRFRWPIPVGS